MLKKEVLVYRQILSFYFITITLLFSIVGIRYIFLRLGHILITTVKIRLQNNFHMHVWTFVEIEHPLEYYYYFYSL